MKTTNPLLQNKTLPEFSKVKPKHIKPAIKYLIAQNRLALKKLLASGKKPQNYTWNNLLKPLEDLHERLSAAWSTVGHLHSVVDSKELRHAYEQTLPLITDYYTALGQNADLYRAINTLAQSSSFNSLDATQQKIIHDELRDFRLAGVALPAKQKQQFLHLSMHLAKLQNKFSNNVLDATQGWSLLLNKKQIQGIPETALAQAKQAAENQGKDGWLFTLDVPSYLPVITYATNRNVRRKIYTAYVTRASAVGPNAHKWDNSKLITQILEIRRKLAHLVSYNNYAEYSLATKMAKSPKDVLTFLDTLAKKSLPIAKNEVRQLKQFALQFDQIKKLEPWDIAYYSEKLAQKNFKISQEELRPYFPLPQVLNGMFSIATKLFGIKIKLNTQVDTWHPDVQFYDVYNEQNELQGQFYLDPYARENKRSGAWADVCRTRRKLSTHKIQIPVAYLTCNFAQPLRAQNIEPLEPALLTHDGVNTLFHEFGHVLHHVLTKVDYAAASGFHGVPWDAVEFPSQFMENWTWESKALRLFAKHYQTDKALPHKMLQQLIRAKNFQAAMQMQRQLEYSLFDFRLHLEFDGKNKHQVAKILQQVRNKVSVVPQAKFNHMQNSFLHIFAHGYAAGYYSYKWAEVLAQDAFAKFTQRGIFDKKTGREFLHCILEMGGSADPLELFKRFRGRAPKIDALLRYFGIK